jgi:predicted ATPase
MPISNEMRRLQAKWNSGGGWPKRLESLELSNVRGWKSLRVDFKFPIVAISGENGSGKSTVIHPRTPGAIMARGS